MCNLTLYYHTEISLFCLFCHFMTDSNVNGSWLLVSFLHILNIIIWCRYTIHCIIIAFNVMVAWLIDLSQVTARQSQLVLRWVFTFLWYVT